MLFINPFYALKYKHNKKYLSAKTGNFLKKVEVGFYFVIFKIDIKMISKRNH